MSETDRSPPIRIARSAASPRRRCHPTSDAPTATRLEPRMPQPSAGKSTERRTRTTARDGRERAPNGINVSVCSPWAHRRARSTRAVFCAIHSSSDQFPAEQAMSVRIPSPGDALGQARVLPTGHSVCGLSRLAWPRCPRYGAVGPYAWRRAHPCIEVWRPRQSRDRSSALRDDSFVRTNLPGSPTETYDGSGSMSGKEDANVGQPPDAGEWREREPPVHVRERVGGIAELDGPEDEVRTEEHLVACRRNLCSAGDI